MHNTYLGGLIAVVVKRAVKISKPMSHWEIMRYTMSFGGSLTQKAMAVNFSFQSFIYSHSFAILNDIDLKFSVVVDNDINVWTAKIMMTNNEKRMNFDIWETFFTKRETGIFLSPEIPIKT